MNYHPQSPNACLAYAAFNLGAVDLEAVREYEQSTRGQPTLRSQLEWAESYAHWLLNALGTLQSYAGVQWYRVPRVELPRRASGVLIVFHVDYMGIFGGTHALAYKDGNVLDSSNDAPGIVESWEEMTQRLSNEGFPQVIPVAFAQYRKRRN